MPLLERQKIAQKKYYDKNAETRRAKAREAYHAQKGRYTSKRMQQRFGITLDDYEAMLALQGGVCAICGGNEPRKNTDGTDRRLAIDHDHKTGKVRQLLCSPCNTAIGLVKESAKTLNKMIEYIKKHEDTNVKTVSVTLTIDEVQALAGLIDAGVKSVGIGGVKAAAAILVKLEEAVAVVNAAEAKEND